ncbi:hypothetical protein REPUB_Repub19eG0119200 [Reevesia pubescens]
MHVACSSPAWLGTKRGGSDTISRGCGIEYRVRMYEVGVRCTEFRGLGCGSLQSCMQQSWLMGVGPMALWVEGVEGGEDAKLGCW